MRKLEREPLWTNTHSTPGPGVSSFTSNPVPSPNSCLHGAHLQPPIPRAATAPQTRSVCSAPRGHLQAPAIPPLLLCLVLGTNNAEPSRTSHLSHRSTPLRCTTSLSIDRITPATWLGGCGRGGATRITAPQARPHRWRMRRLATAWLPGCAPHRRHHPGRWMGRGWDEPKCGPWGWRE